MQRTDKIIIEIGYSKDDIHFTDEQMESMVNNWVKNINANLNDPRSNLYFKAMALAEIHVKKISRESEPA